MKENPLYNLFPTGPDKPKENLEVEVKIATPEDWETYKKLRLLALTGEDKDMFEADPEVERALTEEDWKKYLGQPDRFVMLVWDKDEAIGLGRAKRTSDGFWMLNSGYVTKDLQGKGIGRKLSESRINEIKRRGGKNVITYVNRKNVRSLKLLLSEGFKVVSRISHAYRVKHLMYPMKYAMLEMDLQDKDKK